jgi:Mn2+/Fe2+ NRAMP family transporter
MTFFFWFCWIVDLLMLLVCLYETYAVSSNKSWALPALLLTVLMGASLWYRGNNPTLALILAGIPAGLLLLFLVYFILFAMSNKRWN